MKNFFLFLMLFSNSFSCESLKSTTSHTNAFTPQTVDFGFISISNVKKKLRTISAPEFINGFQEQSLLYNSKIFYTNYWHKYIENGKSFPQYGNPDKDISIILIHGNNAIIEHPAPGFNNQSIFSRKALWVFKDNYWQPIAGLPDLIYDIKITNLNNDPYYDIILLNGCCEFFTYWIISGQENGRFILLQEIIISGTASISIQGPCIQSLITAKPSSGSQEIPRELTFSCITNQFEMD